MKTNNHNMTVQELETLLTERVKTFDIKKKAFDTLHQILSKDPEELIGGFTRDEITLLFEGYQYLIEQRYSGPIIRVRIGLHVYNEMYLGNLAPIGYYDLEMDLDGEIVDDWFVIEKEKYLKDIGIISHFQSMHQKMPLQYLKRNYGQHKFVSYISLVGTLFISKEFQGSGIFIHRAKVFLETDQSSLDEAYLKESKKFLKMMSNYLIENNLISEELKQKLTEDRNND
ncbi:hypothetical protein [Chryseobacterium sp. MEBOG07]|uniref:hypothetical protein n=1 Tax=Chryseobacterium sp. MEBOG07 TaxID=2879939 RepID=UPI001F3C6A94|nr:hypothetical protein [Chryseobacterium sp. MEBOG07]UKB80328.1 hypothetical protein LF886_04825 [Chryseobacterium sp. MEBOG07]